MPRDDEDFYGEGYGELEKRSELVYDLPEPDADAPSGDGGYVGACDRPSDAWIREVVALVHNSIEG